MTIFELFRLVGPIAFGISGYHWAAPMGLGWALLSVLAGLVSGWYVGPWIGLLFLLPFEAAARLERFVRTGHWTD